MFQLTSVWSMEPEKATLVVATLVSLLFTVVYTWGCRYLERKRAKKVIEVKPPKAAPVVKKNGARLRPGHHQLICSQCRRKQESVNSASSLTTTTSSTNMKSFLIKSADSDRIYSASLSGEASTPALEYKKGTTTCGVDMCSAIEEITKTPTIWSESGTVTPQRAQSCILLEMILSFEKQNKFLQEELIKEKRRRTEELACVVKRLICFESKLKADMRAVKQRLKEKDTEIYRLVCQNRAIRKAITRIVKPFDCEDVPDKSIIAGEHEQCVKVADHKNEAVDITQLRNLLKEIPEGDTDYLALKVLRCINCKGQLYGIKLKEAYTQTINHWKIISENHITDHSSSSEDTVTSSFYGARHSLRYTSKHTSGTFQDYMRSRSMNMSDPSLEQNSEENTSTVSRDDSQTTSQKINTFTHIVQRLHGLEYKNERESDQTSLDEFCVGGSMENDKQIDKDAEIKVHDSNFLTKLNVGFEIGLEEQKNKNNCMKITPRKTTEFSEESPVQVYETSTDDWYASASDQEEIGSTTSKSYCHGAVNPVLECVNQILLQQSMEDSANEHHAQISRVVYCDDESILLRRNFQLIQQQTKPQQPKLCVTAKHFLRQSSLSGRSASRPTFTRKRVHFSTKNSMVHVPRNNDYNDGNSLDSNSKNKNENDKNNVTTNAPSANVSANLILIHHNQQHLHHNQTMQSDRFKQQQCQDVKTVTTGLYQEETTSLDETVIADTPKAQEGIENLNYASIYSNEYEPISSDHNSSSLYVDMELRAKLAHNSTSAQKVPPALPPKPSNLFKLKKTFENLEKVPIEGFRQSCFVPNATPTDPDYCSISEVNVAVTNVQIAAEVHNPTNAESYVLTQSPEIPISENYFDYSTQLNSDNSKTDEIEEIFADIPKLPNVAAIIAPKNAKQYQNKSKQQQCKQEQEQEQQNVIMKPELEASNVKMENARKFSLNNSGPEKLHVSTIKPPKIVDVEEAVKCTSLNLRLQKEEQQFQQNNLNPVAKILPRMRQPITATIPTKVTATIPYSLMPKRNSNASISLPVETNLPLQTEFDWYNLDAEYGNAAAQTQLDEPKALSDNSNCSNVLTDLHQEQDCLVNATVEYNLKEDFSTTNDDLKMNFIPGVTTELHIGEASNQANENKTQRFDKFCVDNKLERKLGRCEQDKVDCSRELDELVKNEETNKICAAEKNINAVFRKNKGIPDSIITSKNVRANMKTLNTGSICEPISSPLISETVSHASSLSASTNFNKLIEGCGFSTKAMQKKEKIYFAGPFV